MLSSEELRKILRTWQILVNTEQFSTNLCFITISLVLAGKTVIIMAKNDVEFDDDFELSWIMRNAECFAKEPIKMFSKQYVSK